MEIISNESSREQIFKCEWNDCGKVFDCKGWLLRHQNVHKTQKRFSCNVFGCKKQFAFKIQLKNHLLTHQKENEIEMRAKSDESPKEVTQVVYVGIIVVNNDTIQVSENNLRHSLDETAIKILIEDKFLIRKEYLTLTENLGFGNFGSVYKGILENPNEKREVAIKILKSVCDDMSVECFIREGIMLKDYKHERILTPIGISIDENKLPMIVLPFMANGDLLKYLRKRNNSLTVQKLLSFVQQVAEGMLFLSKQHFIHRDLAARNCLLDENVSVKIGDFGLSRDIYEKDYYRSSNKRPMPVKWMAPESIEKEFFNTKTDVWSFGVLVWEVFTRGVKPYPGIESFDVLRYLNEGNRLFKPINCPQIMYELLLKCWANESELRPNFSEIIQEIEFISDNFDKYVNVSQIKPKSRSCKV